MALHSPGWWGMASPGHSALPQELLLEVEPRRPGGEASIGPLPTQIAGRGSPGLNCGARGLLTPVVVVGGHERAAGGDGCHACLWAGGNLRTRGSGSPSGNQLPLGTGAPGRGGHAGFL